MFNIIDFIPKGHENAITRRALCNITGEDDRTVRIMIHKAKRDNPIMNLQDGKGYFLPADDEIETAERYLKQEENRLKSDGWALKGMRDYLKEHRG